MCVCVCVSVCLSVCHMHVLGMQSTHMNARAQLVPVRCGLATPPTGQVRNALHAHTYACTYSTHLTTVLDILLL